MTEKRLDGADVVAILQEMRRERMPERVTGHPLRHPGAARGVPYGTLDHGLV